MKAGMRSLFFRGENTNIAGKISRAEKEGRNAGASIVFLSYILFSSYGNKTSDIGINGFTSQASKLAHCRSKRAKERRHILSIQFLLLGGVLRLSTKSQGDKWWSHRAENKNKQTATQPKNTFFFFANNRNNRIGTAKNMAEDMGWTPSRKYTTQTARRLQMLYSLLAERGKSTNFFQHWQLKGGKLQVLSTTRVHAWQRKKRVKIFFAQPFISRHHWWHLIFLLPFFDFCWTLQRTKKWTNGNLQHCCENTKTSTAAVIVEQRSRTSKGNKKEWTNGNLKRKTPKATE